MEHGDIQCYSEKLNVNILSDIPARESLPMTVLVTMKLYDVLVFVLDEQLQAVLFQARIHMILILKKNIRQQTIHLSWKYFKIPKE